MEFENIILFLLFIYFLIGFSQFINVYRVKKQISKLKFSKKDFFVSVIVPIKETSEYLEECLESVCKQNYKNFEVLFVAERNNDPACEIARKMVKRYDNALLLISGKLKSKKTIAKSHNLLFGIKHAKGNVFLFTDSDVIHSKDWITELSEPIDEIIDGKKIHATTAPFFSNPQDLLGSFTALSTNYVLFLTFFTKMKQQFPSYASGASICVKRDIFKKAEIEKAWKENFNDDLVFAATIIDRGFNIFSVRKHPNYPIENFGNWKQLNEKMRRWMITVGNFMHKSIRFDAFSLTLLNIQFQVSVVLSLILGILNYFNIIEVKFWVSGLILILGYLYSVIFRAIIVKLVNEKNIMKYTLLTPISHLFWGNYYLFIRFYYKSFSWGGRVYSLK